MSSVDGSSSSSSLSDGDEDNSATVNGAVQGSVKSEKNVEDYEHGSEHSNSSSRQDSPNEAIGDQLRIRQQSGEAYDSDAEDVKPSYDREDTDEKPSQEDLFGDGADVSSDEEGHVTASTTHELTHGHEEEQEEYGRFAGEEEEELEEQQEHVIEVDIPKIIIDQANQTHFVKFPNFLSVESRPFDPETYEDEEEDEILDEEGRARLKLKVENTIRWRNAVDEEGNPVHQSNAKIVRWSDGSMSLYLGTEIFDVHTHSMAADHDHLFIRLGTGLQAHSAFRTKLTFRPHSIDSATHRKMTLSMADRSLRAQKVKVLANVGRNPEAEKQELIKKEEERIRASQRREAQQRRLRERHITRGLSASYLEDRDEEDDDENVISLSALKKRYRPGMRGEHRYSSDEESDTGTKRLEKAKGSADSDEERSGTPAKKKPRVIEESDEDT